MALVESLLTKNKWKKNMSTLKKIFLSTLFVVSFLSYSNVSQATRIAELSVEVASAIAPYIPKALTKFEGAIRYVSDKKCFLLCDKGAKAQCFLEVGRSFCKNMCQTTSNVGPFTLNIRFNNTAGNTWTLEKCLLRQTRAAKTDRTIAIYSQENLDLAKTTIAKIMALDEFILVQGKFDTTKGAADADDIKSLVEKAKEERARLMTDFLAYVKENFGKQ